MRLNYVALIHYCARLCADPQVPRIEVREACARADAWIGAYRAAIPAERRGEYDIDERDCVRASWGIHAIVCVLNWQECQ